MFVGETNRQEMKFLIIFLFLFSACTASCVNRTVSFQDLLKNQEINPLPNIPLEKFGNKYYYFGIVYEGSYYQAMQFCNYNGMTLLSIETKEENDFLWQKLNPLLGVGEYYFWTSGTTMSTPHWVWLATGKPIIYANWFPNQPDNAGNNEKCLEVRYGHTNKAIMWNDHVCTVPKRVICETPEVKCTTHITMENVPIV